MNILGFDPGYQRCGFSVFEKGKNDPKLITYGLIETSSKKAFPVRLAEIAEDTEALIKKHKPDIVAIEDLFFVKNITTALKVAEVRGVITFLAQKYNCQVLEPKPVEVKSSFTGDGQATKSAMKKMAELQWGISGKGVPDDVVDAIAVGMWAVHHSTFQ